MAIAVLSLLALMSASVLIQAERTSNRRVVYAAKPLTTITLLVIALTAMPVVDDPYRNLIAAGIVASLAGDIFLMWPQKYFVGGLVSFFVAHVFYIWAFVDRSIPSGPGPFMPFLIAALFVARLLWPHAGKLRIPVAAYATILAVMAGCALSAAVSIGSLGAWLAAVGSILFLLSDAALGMDRFVGSIKGGRTLVLATYYPAQWLIVLSIAVS